jgi:pyrimidine operon attenuation protein/uracil phosphoribosyltransferase
MGDGAQPTTVHANTVLSGADLARAISRIAHEIVERNHASRNVCIVGMQRGGVWIAELLARKVNAIDPAMQVALGSLDVSMYRDDISLRPTVEGAITSIEFEVDDRTVILVDDVLYTGRTVRAALEALNTFGRPRGVQLAVLVDRGHRELPIRPDFVGKNIPTHLLDEVDVSEDGVVITRGSHG